MLNTPITEPLKKFRKIHLFDCLDDQQVEEVAPFFNETAFDRHTVIFHEDDPVSETQARTYFVIKGCVKMVKYSEEGESTIMRMATTGEFFGTASALSNGTRSFSAEALTDTVVLSIERNDLIKVVETFPHISLNIIVAMGEMLWFSYETRSHVAKRADARVAKIMMYHLKRDGWEETSEGKLIKLNLPHDYIASMTGIAYEESVRIISRFKKEYQCINYHRGGRIVIIDEKKLQEIGHVSDIWASNMSFLQD